MANKIQVYNRATGLPEMVDSESIDQAVLSGTHGFDIDSRVNVVSPDGEAGSLPATEIAEAIQDGYKIEKPDQKAVREYVEENQGIKGAAKVFAGQAIDEALMGIPELVYDKTADPLDLAKKEALKKQHDFANTVGGVTGFLGSMSYGAPLAKLGGKVAEQAAGKVVGEQLVKAGIEGGASLGQKVISTAITSAGEGLALSAPRALTEAALGDPKEAAESLAIGMGTGALFGVTTPLFKKLYQESNSVISRAAKNIKETILPGEKEAVYNVFSMTPTDISRFNKNNKGIIEELPGFMKANITPTEAMSDSALPEKLSKIKEETGKKIGELIDRIDASFQTGPGARVKKNVLDKADSRVRSMYRELRKDANEYASKPAAEYQSAANKMNEFIDNSLEQLRAGEGPKSLKALQQMKIDMQNLSNYSKQVGVKNTPMEMFYKKAAAMNADIMYKFAQDYSEKLGAVKMFGKLSAEVASAGAELAELNKKFRISSALLPYAEKRVGKGGARSMFSFNNLIPAAAGATFGAGLGGPLGAAIGAILPEMARYGRPVLGLYYAEKAQAALARKLDMIPDALKNFGGVSKGSIYSGSINGMSRLIDSSEEGSKKTKIEQFNDVAKKLNEYAADPDKMVNAMAKVTAPMGEAIPNIKSEYNNLLTAQMNYLQQNMPKDTNPVNPFVKNQWQPNDSQLNKFERIASVVHDPFTVVEDLKNGSLTKDQVDALRNVYPKIYNRIQGKVMNHLAADKQGGLNYQARLKLGMLFGVNADSSLNNIPSKQQTFAPTQPESAPKQQSTNAKITLADHVSSDVGRLSTK